MREKRSFAIRTRVLASDEVRKKYFLVYEGEKTEQIYFDEVNLYRSEIGINPLIELVPIVRSYSERGWSNPKKILDCVLKNLEENKSESVSYETLLNWIMEYLHEEKILTTSKVQSKVMWDTLFWICSEKLHACLDDMVEDIESTCTKIANYFVDAAGIKSIVNDVPKIIRNRSITYAEELDTDQLLKNPKVTSKRRYTEQQLRALLPGYSKAKYDAASLVKKIDVAIENEKNFCEDDQALEYSVGSKIGLLIEELRGIGTVSN